MREKCFLAKTLQGVILVGGRGTRLGALTVDTPKPLLSVAGQPFLAYLLAKLDSFGFDEVILLSGYRSECMDAFVKQFVTGRMRILNIPETEPAGTAGALLGAEPYLQDFFIMMNGDSLFDFNWLDLITVGARDSSAVMSLALREMPEGGRYGSVNISREKVTAIGSTSSQESTLVNGGVYWVNKAVLKHIESSPCSLEKDIFSKLASNDRLRGRVYNGFFLDIGVPEDLHRAEQQIPEQFQKPPIYVDLAMISNPSKGVLSAVRSLNNAGIPVVALFNSASNGNNSNEHLQVTSKKIITEMRPAGAHIDRIVNVAQAGSDSISATFLPGLDFTAEPGIVWLSDMKLAKHPMLNSRRCVDVKEKSLPDLVESLGDLRKFQQM